MMLILRRTPRRLNHGGVDPITAATEAFRLFADAATELEALSRCHELQG
jgi:hypothetical protein